LVNTVYMDYSAVSGLGERRESVQNRAPPYQPCGCGRRYPS
jgi:hypothetical protein